MNLNPLGANKTELTFEKDGQRVKVLFSYKTPVACEILTDEGMLRYKTVKRWSNTTSKHINSWLLASTAELKEQDFFDNLVKVA